MEMDGIDGNNDGVLIIGATNAPWDLDSALRRPGRFDRIIFVPPPDMESRKTILKLKLQGRPTEHIDYSKIASRTKGYSGADLESIIDIAVENILEEALLTGTPKPITTSHLLSALKKTKPSTVEWFSTVKNYAAFSNKSGIYDDVVHYMKSNKL